MCRGFTQRGIWRIWKSVVWEWTGSHPPLLALPHGIYLNTKNTQWTSGSEGPTWCAACVVVVLFLEAGALHVVLAVLEVATFTRLALNSEIGGVCLPSAGI